MPLEVSKGEVMTDDWDKSIGPVMPGKKYQFKLQNDKEEGIFVISTPL